MKWMTKPRLLIAALSLTSAAAGAAAGFVAASRILETKFQERLETELADARSYFQQMYSTPVFVADEEDTDGDKLIEEIHEAVVVNDPPPEDLVGKALAAARTYDAELDSAVEPGDPRTPPPTVVNIFNNPTVAGDEVIDALKESRDPAEPYIITKEEFLHERT